MKNRVTSQHTRKHLVAAQLKFPSVSIDPMEALVFDHREPPNNHNAEEPGRTAVKNTKKTVIVDCFFEGKDECHYSVTYVARSENCPGHQHS